MSIGPVEYMVVVFPGNRFNGEIVPALADLVDAGTVRIIDLAVVSKDADGAVVALEIADLESEVGEALAEIGGTTGGLLNAEDLEAAGEELPPNSTAALLVWEDVWATRLADAIRTAGGEIIDLERIPRDIVQAAIDFAAAN